MEATMRLLVSPFAIDDAAIVIHTFRTDHQGPAEQIDISVSGPQEGSIAAQQEGVTRRTCLHSLLN
jgi:uncharacterized protein (UPF0264 family)